MLKKLIAASAAFALFACSSDSSGGGGNGGEGDTPSSSSGGGTEIVKDTATVVAHGFKGASQIFNTYPYGYTLKAGEEEDLTQFWDSSCPLDTGNDAPGEDCELDKTNAILQNTLTSQYSSLHYVIDKVKLAYPNEAVELKSYKLTEDGDQAALGFNAGADANEGKSIGDLNITNFNGIKSLVYRYWGGAHEFRAVSKTDDDFWFYKAAASKTDTTVVTIPIGDLVGNGAFAEDEEAGTSATPFDISKVAKFLWVVEYDAEEPANNTGSLLVDYLEAKIEK